MKSLSAHPDEELANGRDTKGPILFGSGNDLDGTSRWNVVVSLRRWENISYFRHWLLMGTSRFLSWDMFSMFHVPCFWWTTHGPTQVFITAASLNIAWIYVWLEIPPVQSPCVIYIHLYNPFTLLLNVPQILRTGVHLQFQKISDWPIWLLIEPL